MRHNVREFVKVCRDTLPILGPIYEFGSYQCEGQADIADLRPLFPGKEYVGTDMRAGPGVDKVMNLLDLQLAAGSVGTALCLDTLEHVRDPFRAMSEIRRVLKPGGVVIVSSHMNWPVHHHPEDYWRFTPGGMARLLGMAGDSWTCGIGDGGNFHTVVGVGQHCGEIHAGQAAALSSWALSQASSRLQRARRYFLPPVAFDCYKLTRKIARHVLGRDKEGK